MKHLRAHTLLIVIVLASLLVGAFFDVRTNYAQSRRTSSRSGNSASKVKPTGLPREGSAEDPSGRSRSSVPGAAVGRNAQLRTELIWTFGGKQQRGWYLYSTLIQRLLDTELDPTTEGFAAALALWQKHAGLTQTGVLDENSLNAMVSKWQQSRLKNRAPASSEKMIVAPASDFYDPSRKDELRMVEPETYAAYKRMVAAAIADRSVGLASDRDGELVLGEKFLKIISAFRTSDYQERLRRESPNAGRAGLAVNSPHFTGRALDLYVGGEPVETKDANRAVQVNTPVYKWLVRNADKFGFRPYFYEPWHWEYVK
jgi:D-alanyl-D-alanine carboxypeptidase